MPDLDQTMWPITASKDPFPGITSLPQSLHPYVYCFNNAVNLTDPSGAVPPLIAYPAGVLVQYFNDMNLGGVSAAYTTLTGKTLDDIQDRAFQAGRHLGRDISEALAWFEVLGGGALMATAAAGAPLAAAAAAGAPFTSGLSLLVTGVDVGAFVLGAILSAQGVARLAYIGCNRLPAPHVSYSTGSGSGSTAGSGDPRVKTDPAKGRFDSSHASYDKALQKARGEAGSLGPNTQKMYDPKTGTLIGEQSADGTRGWRIDADHVNWWDWTGGKRGSGGRYGHEFFPPDQSGPHSEHTGYGVWE